MYNKETQMGKMAFIVILSLIAEFIIVGIEFKYPNLIPDIIFAALINIVLFCGAVALIKIVKIKYATEIGSKD